MGLDHSQEARATNKVVTVRQGWYYRPSCHQIVILTLTMGGDNHNIANNFHSEFDNNLQLTAEDEREREIFSERKCENYLLIINFN